MQYIRISVLRHVRIRNCIQTQFMKDAKSLVRERRHICAASSTSSDHLMARVIGLVKKIDKIDSSKVTETADFQKDLCLDSLDKVELVMAFEQEFSVEIPDEKADKLLCCADVVKYILSETKNNTAANS